MPTDNNFSGFRPASQLTARPLAFLWQNRLPIGKLAILDGDPGLGKSLVSLDLCARLSTGRPFPDGTPSPGPANCIALNGEDGDADTLAPRLQALGADLNRVFVSETDSDALPLRLPSQIAALDQQLKTTAAKLVVIDPVAAFLDPSVQTFSDASVRQALTPLARLAAKHQCVMLLIRHLNKTGNQRALYRGGGSIGFVAACRTAWLIAPDPEHPRHCILAQNKNNVAPPQPSLSYQLVTQEGQPPLVSWLEGTRPFTGEQLLGKAGRGGTLASALAQACDFLTTFLENGPQEARAIWKAAEKESFGERTLKTAKSQLKIRSVQVWTNGRHLHYWQFPDQELPDTIPPESIVPDLEPWLEPLRQQFPPATPLDDM